MTYQEINQCRLLGNLPNEIFKDIPNYKGYYQVSNLGRVKSLQRLVRGKKSLTVNEKILKIFITDKGYCAINLYKNCKIKGSVIHRLVLLTFIGKSNLEVNHKNGIKQDNKLENLEYMTTKENVLHAIKNNLFTNSLNNLHKHNNSIKKKIIQYDLNGNFIKEYNSICEAVRKTNIAQSRISGCVNNRYGYKSAGGYIWKKAE